MAKNPVRIPEGGGLTAPSLIDEVTVDEHVTGRMGRTEDIDNGDVSLLHGDQYGFPGTGVEQPEPDGYTVDEATADFKRYVDASNFDKLVPIRNVAGLGRHLSFNLNGTMGPLLVAGADQFRKKVVLRLAPTATNPIYIGTNGAIQRQAGGDQSLLYAGQQITIEHMDDIYVLTDAAVTVAAPVVLSVDIERFER